VKIVIGSGTTPQNIKELMKYADSAIVGTYLKTNNRVDVKKVREIMGLAMNRESSVMKK